MMKPMDPELEKMLGELFTEPKVLETDEEKFRQAVQCVRRFLVWIIVASLLGYGVLISLAVVIVLGWLKLFGVI